MLKKAISATLLLALVSILLPVMASAEVPDWVRALARHPAKTYADDVDAVILADDQVTTVKENGEIVTQGRLALKILRADGRKLAAFPVPYDSDSKVSYLHGWSITEKGQEYEAKASDVFEQTVSSFEVYSDLRIKALRVPGADIGSVVAFEYEQNRRPYIMQDFWDFQSFLPVEESRYELHLAGGWRVKTDWVNHPAEKPNEENGALVWQLGDVPRIEREPHRPPSEALAGRMVITFLSDKMPTRSYRDWAEFGSWYTQLSAGVRNASPALQQKVQELAPGNMSVLERIKALAHFAQQDVRYVEIRIGVGSWRPHSAGDVFTHRYGDCKDKATVLSSMLAQIGVKSYYVLVHTNRGIFTRNSPPQARFDHMILAIALPDASYGKPFPATLEHPKLGRLLIFDPTNDRVPFGQIPSYEQDNYGLLVTDQGGDLINLPLSSPQSNAVTRTAKLNLLADGTLTGEVEEVRTGFEAMNVRLFLQHATDAERKKAVEQLLGRSMSNFRLDSFELVHADDIDKDLILRFKFTAEHYAKNAGPLLLVRPRVVGEMAGAWDPNKPRHYAYDFPGPSLSSDRVEITLPDGFKVDELPPPAKALFSFGEYTSKSETVGNVLKYSRDYKVAATEVPLADIEQLKKLFSTINVDEKSTAVLKKAN